MASRRWVVTRGRRVGRKPTRLPLEEGFEQAILRTGAKRRALVDAAGRAAANRLRCRGGREVEREDDAFALPWFQIRALLKSMTSLRTWLGWLIGAALVVPAVEQAHAFCYRASCKADDMSSLCIPDRKCRTLVWPGACASYSISEAKDLPEMWDDYDFGAYVDKAFEQWLNVECANRERPSITVRRTANVVCQKAEFNQDAGNANQFIFKNEIPDGDESAVSRTTLNLDVNQGIVLGVDVEVNVDHSAFKQSGADRTAMLQSLLLYEVGQFLGLSDSDKADSVMGNMPWFSTSPDAAARVPWVQDRITLTADDTNGLCFLYAPGTARDKNCSALPRHGFAKKCGNDQVRYDCAVGYVGLSQKPDYPPVVTSSTLPAGSASVASSQHAAVGVDGAVARMRHRAAAMFDQQIGWASAALAFGFIGVVLYARRRSTSR